MKIGAVYFVQYILCLEGIVVAEGYAYGVCIEVYGLTIRLLRK